MEAAALWTRVQTFNYLRNWNSTHIFSFFKFDTALVDLLFIELILHLSHVKQMCSQTIHLTHELKSCIQIIRRLTCQEGWRHPWASWFHGCTRASSGRRTGPASHRWLAIWRQKVLKYEHWMPLEQWIANLLPTQRPWIQIALFPKIFQRKFWSCWG